MKKIIYLLLLLIFLITGCKSYLELNDLSIINAIGIEKINDNYHIYISLINSLNQETKEPQIKVIQSEGENLKDAFNNLRLSLNKKIYLSHLNLLLVNETIKTKEFENIIKFFVNNQDTREDFLVCFANDLKTIFEQAKFQEINNLVKINYQETSLVTYTTMYDLIKNYYENKPLYLTNIIYDNALKVKNVKLFKNNHYQDLNNQEPLFYNYLENNIQTYHYDFLCEPNKFISLKVLKANAYTFRKELIITNEINIITNDCNLNKKEINQHFTNFLKDNLGKLSNQKIIIKNTLRGNYEN